MNEISGTVVQENLAYSFATSPDTSGVQDTTGDTVPSIPTNGASAASLSLAAGAAAALILGMLF